MFSGRLDILTFGELQASSMGVEVKKTKIEVYEEEIKMLRQMVFSMIKGGTSNG